MKDEWLLLQSQHEHYEFAALAIKLLAVLLLAVGLGRTAPPVLAGLLALLWMQEAIVKTFQARLAARLLRLEQLLLRGDVDAAAMQLHSEWAQTRPRGLRLLAEYALSACRPTVAFPHPLLIVAALLLG